MPRSAGISMSSSLRSIVANLSPRSSLNSLRDAIRSRSAPGVPIVAVDHELGARHDASAVLVHCAAIHAGRRVVHAGRFERRCDQDYDIGEEYRLLGSRRFRSCGWSLRAVLCVADGGLRVPPWPCCGEGGSRK